MPEASALSATEPKRDTLAPSEPVRTRPEPGKVTARQEEIWAAVEEHGSQSAAARALGVTQGAIQSGLRGYMKAKGMTGEMPGYRPKDHRGEAKARAQIAKTKRNQAAKAAAVQEPQDPPEQPLSAPMPPGYAEGYAVAVLRVVAGWESNELPEFLQDMASDAADGLMR